MNISIREIILIYLCLLLCGLLIRCYLQHKNCIEWEKEQHEKIIKQKKLIETQHKLEEAQNEKIASQQELIEAQENLIKRLRIRSIDKIVRCKDCAYWQPYENNPDIKVCTRNFRMSFARYPEDYCSRGERKERE